MGTPAASLLGRVHWEVHPSRIGTPAEAFFRKAMAEGVAVHFESHYEPADLWFDVSACPSREGLAIYSRDITDRKRGEAARLRLNEDLKQFTFAATHDVREPLRMITTSIQLLQRKFGHELREQAKEYLANAVNGAQRISSFLDSLPEFSRVADVDSAESSTVDSELAFKEAIDNLQIAVAEEHATITHNRLPAVIGNSGHICQLFQNLVGNAMKYHAANTPPQIHVSVRREGPQYVFAVRDNGIGIAPEYHSQIFVPFKRLHGSEIDGSGIGLATCKRIVERYGGRIWVHSNEGEGSTFYFSLSAADDRTAGAVERGR
jgi:light-regulated signal transduction histidine kinase (bacteriophytochrome)